MPFDIQGRCKVAAKSLKKIADGKTTGYDYRPIGGS